MKSQRRTGEGKSRAVAERPQSRAGAGKLATCGSSAVTTSISGKASHKHDVITMINTDGKFKVYSRACYRAGKCRYTYAGGTTSSRTSHAIRGAVSVSVNGLKDGTYKIILCKYGAWSTCPLEEPGLFGVTNGKISQPCQAEKCTELFSNPGNIRAEKAFLQTQCEKIPDGAKFLKITMGEVVDYFKPLPGESMCDLLTKPQHHKWSKDGKTWVRPSILHNNGPQGSWWGGSDDWYPKTNIPGDERRYLSFWGTTWRGNAGGCCSKEYNTGETAWHQAYKLYTCSSSGMAAPKARHLTLPEGTMVMAHKDLKVAEAFYANGTTQPGPMFVVRDTTTTGASLVQTSGYDAQVQDHSTEPGGLAGAI